MRKLSFGTCLLQVSLWLVSCSHFSQEPFFSSPSPAVAYLMAPPSQRPTIVQPQPPPQGLEEPQPPSPSPTAAEDEPATRSGESNPNQGSLEPTREAPPPSSPAATTSVASALEEESPRLIGQEEKRPALSEAPLPAVLPPAPLTRVEDPLEPPLSATRALALLDAADPHPFRYTGPGAPVSFPLEYVLVNQMLPGLCPKEVSIACEALPDGRTEGPVRAEVLEKKLYVASQDPDECDLKGLEPLLTMGLFKVCLGQMTLQNGRVLSREEKGLRFLEEGFAHYLLTRPEAATIGVNPTAYAYFLDFVAANELAAGFTFQDFWNRLPTRAELESASASIHPRRLEAQYVAGAFITWLIESQGLEVDGYIALWKAIQAVPLRIDANGVGIPKVALEPVLNQLLETIGRGGITDINQAWQSFSRMLQDRPFDQPSATLSIRNDTLVLVFTQEMMPDKIDLTFDQVQLGPERLSEGLAMWTDDHTYVVNLEAISVQLGLDELHSIRINEGKVWQWFRSARGIPARPTTLSSQDRP